MSNPWLAMWSLTRLVLAVTSLGLKILSRDGRGALDHTDCTVPYR
jgi:hypothetical protein